MLQTSSQAAPARDKPLELSALESFVEGAGWSSPSAQAFSPLDAVGAAATRLRRTSSSRSARPATPTLEGWSEVPARSNSSSVTAMSSSDASASPPASLQASDCSALRDASLSDGGETLDTDSLEVLREELRRMQLRLAESERTGFSLAHELDSTQEHFSSSLATLQSEHASAMQTLESNLRAEAQDALDAAATELEAAASERAHLWSLLRDSGKEESTPPQQRSVPRRASVGHVTSARAAAWATP